MINKEYFQWFEKYLAGVTPEFFLALYISFFFCFVAGVRYYLRHYTNTLQEGIETHSNDVAAVLSVIGLLVYLFFIYSSPVSVENLDFGVYTDATVYLFRLAIGVIFIIFFSYTAITSITFSGYKFEYYFVLVVAYWGLNLMLISANFLILFLAMEVYSVAIYYLLVSKRFSNTSVEAAIKYFVVSAVSTAFFLYGVYVLYHIKGTINYNPLFMLNYIDSPMEYYGYSLVISALFIKVGAGIFYFWTLDSYEGASLPIMMFLNLFVKPVFVYVVFKIIFSNGAPSTLRTVYLLVMLYTIIIGVLGATNITKIKKFLIYTSLYNVGFLGSFFWFPSPTMFAAFILFYVVYSINSLGLMLVVCYFRNEKKELYYDDWKTMINISTQSPPIAFALVFFLLALSGLPPFSLFFVKYFLYVKLFMEHYYLATLILLLVNILMLFLYVRLVRLILSNNKETSEIFIFDKGPIPAIVSLLTVFNLIFFMFSGYILEFINVFVAQWPL